MRAVRGKDTKPEMAVRRLVHGMGLRFRLHKSGLPGKPDLVLARHRLAVFVHGCFWHGHDCPRGARVPKTNRAFWTAKIGRNTARDRAVKRGLRAAGWRVLVVWECQLRDMGRVERRLRALTSDGSPDAHGRRDNAPSPSYKTRRTSSPRIGNRE